MPQEDAEKFEEDIGMRTSPEKIARDALKAHQEATGMTFENPDAVVHAPLGSRDEEVPGNWMNR
jgi:hypothetical protein